METENKYQPAGQAITANWNTKKVTEYSLTPQDVINLLASVLNVQPEQILLLDDIDNLDFKVTE